MRRNIASEGEYIDCIQELIRVENDPDSFLFGNPSILATPVVAGK